MIYEKTIKINIYYLHLIDNKQYTFPERKKSPQRIMKKGFVLCPLCRLTCCHPIVVWFTAQKPSPLEISHVTAAKVSLSSSSMTALRWMHTNATCQLLTILHRIYPHIINMLHLNPKFTLHPSRALHVKFMFCITSHLCNVH